MKRGLAIVAACLGALVGCGSEPPAGRPWPFGEGSELERRTAVEVARLHDYCVERVSGRGDPAEGAAATRALAGLYAGAVNAPQATRGRGLIVYAVRVARDDLRACDPALAARLDAVLP